MRVNPRGQERFAEPQDAKPELGSLRGNLAAKVEGKRLEELPARSEVDLYPQIWLLLEYLEVAIEAAKQDHTDLSACDTIRKKLTSAFVKFEARVKRAAPAGEAPAGEGRIDLNTLALEVNAARKKLSSTIENLNEAKKKMARLVTRKAIDRLVKATQQAAQSNDLANVELMFRQLTTKVTKLERITMSKEGDTDPQDEAKLQEAEAALRKLDRRRQQLKQRNRRQPQEKENCSLSENSPYAGLAPPTTLDFKRAVEECIWRCMAAIAKGQSYAEAKVIAAFLEMETCGDDDGGDGEEGPRKKGLEQDPADSKGRVRSPCLSSGALAQTDGDKGEPAVAKIMPVIQEVAGTANGNDE
jgi:hypothetical protein